MTLVRHPPGNGIGSDTSAASQANWARTTTECIPFNSRRGRGKPRRRWHDKDAHLRSGLVTAGVNSQGVEEARSMLSSRIN